MASAMNAPDMAMSHEPKVATPLYEATEKELGNKSSHDGSVVVAAPAPVEFDADLEGEEPTEEDLRTLTRVSGKIPWSAYTIAFVELCERFGYYGCAVLCMFYLFCLQVLVAGIVPGRVGCSQNSRLIWNPKQIRTLYSSHCRRTRQPGVI